MKRGVWEERGCPSTEETSMKNIHLVGRFQGLRGERSCSAAEVGGDGGDGPCGIPLEMTSSKAATSDIPNVTFS